MQLNDLFPFAEEGKKRHRVGRGGASGWGSTSGRGTKGQNARSGGGVRPGFEGGQMPLQRRLPKHGFKNALFRIVFEVVNLDTLQAAFDGKNDISLEDIYRRGLARFGKPVKILARGELTAPLSVEAHMFSREAARKIQEANGTVRELLSDCAS